LAHATSVDHLFSAASSLNVFDMDTVLRSLSACSLLLSLGSGLHLERPAVASSMDSDTQEGKLHAGPTWEGWRREPDDMLKVDTSTEAASVNVSLFKTCANFSSPSQNQFSATLDLDKTHQLMLLADHIYCLCVQCDFPTFPSSWAGKVSMLDVLQADTCLEQQNLDHYNKATTMHKLVIWAAKDQNHRTAMVLEEDFVLPDSTTAANINPDYDALEAFIINDWRWDFLRFGHQPYGYISGGRCYPQCFCAKDELSNDVCTPVGSCDIRSTVAYMVAIRESIVDGVLNASGWIDKFIMQSFKNSYIVPAIIYQNGKLEEETMRDSSFREHCLTG